MRLIDADDVIETISHYLGKKLYATYPNDKMPEFDKGVIDGYARARSIVFETPTADHVKHGRWMYNEGETIEDGGYCSVCGCDQPVFMEDWEWKYVETDYCPNCGAKMDEEG